MVHDAEKLYGMGSGAVWKLRALFVTPTGAGICGLAVGELGSAFRAPEWIVPLGSVVTNGWQTDPHNWMIKVNPLDLWVYKVREVSVGKRRGDSTPPTSGWAETLQERWERKRRHCGSLKGSPGSWSWDSFRRSWPSARERWPGTQMTHTHSLSPRFRPPFPCWVLDCHIRGTWSGLFSSKLSAQTPCQHFSFWMWAKQFPWALNPLSSCLLFHLLSSLTPVLSISLSTFSHLNNRKALKKHTHNKIKTNILLQVYTVHPNMATTPPVGSFLRHIFPVPLRHSALQQSSGLWASFLHSTFTWHHHERSFLLSPSSSL